MPLENANKQDGAMSDAADAPPPRRVYYFHGFDPLTTARYRRIFAAAAERLALDLDDLPGREGWRIARDGVRTEVHQCRYEDLVRAWQNLPLWQRIARGGAALISYARDGALGRMARLGPRNLMLALSPVLLTILVALGLALFLANAQTGPVGTVIAILLALLVLLLAIPALYLHLVMDLFAYLRVLARGAGPVWRSFISRTGTMADMVDHDEPGEVVIVGDSLGGVTAIHALDALLARWPEGRPIGLMTLGSVHGTVLVQQGDGRDMLASAIGRIAADPRVFWVDVSSPHDSFCLPLLDPLLLIDAQAGMSSPRVISARLGQASRIPGDRGTVFAAMRRHMGYLLAPESGSGFDYADTISGPSGLRERFSGRGNSPRARMWRA